MPLESRIKYNKVILTYKALNNMTPGYLAMLLNLMSQTHSLNLRSGENGVLYVHFSRNVINSGAFSCPAPQVLNSLPLEIRISESQNAFETNVKSLC